MLDIKQALKKWWLWTGVVVVVAVLLFVVKDKPKQHLTVASATAPVQVVENADLLTQKGVTLDAISATKSLKTTDGACGSRGTYSKYYYDPAGFLSVTSETNGKYTCTMYDLNALKSFTTADGSKIDSNTHTNVNGTSTRVTNNSSTGQTTVTVTNDDGTAQSSTGTNIYEKCFGANNTVCTQMTVDENMITTCLLVPDSGYYRIATPGDNTLSLTWYSIYDQSHMNPNSCAGAPNFHVQFYNK
jgi:hypothetical protein